MPAGRVWLDGVLLEFECVDYWTEYIPEKVFLLASEEELRRVTETLERELRKRGLEFMKFNEYRGGKRAVKYIVRIPRGYEDELKMYCFLSRA